MFDDFALMKDRDSIAQVSSNGEIVRDKQEGKMFSVLDVLDELDDLLLCQDVESRCRFVENQQSRLRAESSSDCYTLTLSAAELRWEPPEKFFRKPNGIEQRAQRLFRLRCPCMQACFDAFHERVSYVHVGVERSTACLEDHLNFWMYQPLC